MNPDRLEVFDETHVMDRATVERLLARSLPDADVKRPLWEFDVEQRPAILHERARRWGTPSPDDFDPEYH